MGSYEENEKKARTILEQAIGTLSRNYAVRKLDAGEFADQVTFGTQFRIAHYEIEKVGHLMTMYTEGSPDMLMATFTLTPYFKKLPLVSSDFIFNGDGGMSLIEIYELVKNREDVRFREWIRKYSECFKELADIEDIPAEPGFYDSIRPVYIRKRRTSSRDEDIIRNLIDTLEIFIEQEKAGELLDEEDAAEQKAIQHRYVDDLIDQNGFSTKIWVKEHGVDYVRRFFHGVFFGV